MQAQEHDWDVYQHLLDETGRKVGITGLVFDDQGMCSLRIGGVLVVLLRDLRLQGVLLLRDLEEEVPLAALPLAMGAALHPLLEGWPTPCRLPDGDRVVCLAFLPLREFTPSYLLRLLARLVDWRAPPCPVRPAAGETTRSREARCFDRV